MSEAAAGPTATPRLRWQVDVGAVVTARPLLLAAAGAPVQVVVASHAGRVLALATDDGATVFEAWLDGIVWSSPALDHDDRIWVGADDDVLYALDRTGAVLQRVRLGSCDPPRARGPEGVRCDVDGGPTVMPDGDLLVGADGVYRLSRAGAVRWHSPADGVARHVGTAPLVTGGRVVFGGYDGNLTALAEDGTPAWVLPIGADVDGDPIAGVTGDIYAGADDGKLWAVSPEGAARWSFATKAPIIAAVAIAPDGHVLVPSTDGTLYALTPGGALAWSFTTGGALAATPTLDRAGHVYVGSRDDRLYALTPAGKPMWSLEFPGDLDAPVVVTPAGWLIVVGDDGYVRALSEP
ncbi:MAG: PQQ-binding-like beta-propeller repeat protein [Deltaproteobacteria bacterium]|nr:PQQ-binding-like beta-propeller repeat protein [Deltaproteobacteria bacterium]